MPSIQQETKYEAWFSNQMDQLGQWEWNETGVDVVLTNPNGNSDIEMKRAEAFFTAIEAPHLKEGSITKLFAAGITSTVDIVNSSEWTLTQVLGANGVKIHSGLGAALTDIPLYKIMGAVSNERGLAVRKMKKLQQALGADRILDEDLSHDEIAGCDGFDSKTATKVGKTIDAYRKFITETQGNITVDMGNTLDADGILADKKICMTGFRDKALAEQIEELGGTIQSGVSGKTDILVTSNPSSNSGKAKKARDLGVKIMGVDEFKELIDV